MITPIKLKILLQIQHIQIPTGEVVKVTKAKYIVSNIVLTKEDGSIYVVPKSQSYFIVDELTSASLTLNIPNVPAANYTKVKFGIGVDKSPI